MSEQQSNIISFIEAVKKRYYGPEYRELSFKKQLHLMDAVIHDDFLKFKKDDNLTVKKSDLDGILNGP